MNEFIDNKINTLFKMLKYKDFIFPCIINKESISIAISKTVDESTAELVILERHFCYRMSSNLIGTGDNVESAVNDLVDRIIVAVEEIALMKTEAVEIERKINELEKESKRLLANLKEQSKKFDGR